MDARAHRGQGARATAPFSDGETVWFLKSMRKCRVVSRQPDGLYTVVVEGGTKEMTATADGLCRPGDPRAPKE